jgi:hypothetical protein
MWMRQIDALAADRPLKQWAIQNGRCGPSCPALAT